MKIIHVADVHLGAEPDLGFPWSKERAADIHRTFQRIIRRCKEERTDLLLIAGDLFHRPPLPGELRELNYLFKGIAETRVVLAAGNHDYLKKGGCYGEFAWNENVTMLRGERCERVEIPGLDLAVYGCSYHSREITEPLYDEVKPEGRQKYHILVGHGGDAKHSPIDFARLQAAGFTYAALGHIHKPKIFPGGRIAYAGAPEPVDCNDFGPHGYMEIECGPRGAAVRFVPAAVCEYRELSVQVGEESTQLSVEEEIRARISSEGEKNIYHLRLEGVRGRGTEFNLLKLMKRSRIVRAQDQSHPYYDLEELEQAYGGSLVGEYIRRLQSGAGDIPKTVREKALYYGLEALLDAKR